MVASYWLLNGEGDGLPGLVCAVVISHHLSAITLFFSLPFLNNRCNAGHRLLKGEGDLLPGLVCAAVTSHHLSSVTLLRSLPFLNYCCNAGYRLLNGEGDLLPGLVCDVYGSSAVLKLDGDGPAGFYDAKGIAGWLQQQLQLQSVYLKHR
jgi:hypothetical protein